MTYNEMQTPLCGMFKIPFKVTMYAVHAKQQITVWPSVQRQFSSESCQFCSNYQNKDIIVQIISEFNNKTLNITF